MKLESPFFFSMTEKLKFLISLFKLKETPRTGWVLMKVNNPETIADHIFRVCIGNWLLGEQRGLKGEKLIKIVLCHDFCEVYAGDKTPFFYWDELDRNKPEQEQILLKGVRLSAKEKERRSKTKFETEKNSLLKLISLLDDKLKAEIFANWLDFEKKLTPEGKFSKQMDRIETLIQAIEYLGKEKTKGGSSWWELTEEIVEDPFLLDFLKVIQKRFYGKILKITFKKQKFLENFLDFYLKIGKLKRMPRLYWRLRGVQNPESVAGHIFTLSVMAWIFGKERKELNQEKLLKMALCHELSAVYTGDTTPYDRILPKNEKERKKVLEKMIRLSKKEKEWIFLADFKKEKKAMEKLTKKIPQRKEILELWEDYRKRKSKEAKFLFQLNALSVLLQGLIYEKEGQNSATPLWEWVFETCDDPLAISLAEEMKRYFYAQN